MTASRSPHRISTAACIVGVIAAALPLVAPAARAEDTAPARTAAVVRAIPTSEFGVPRPRGIAYAPKDGALFLPAADANGTLDLTGITPGEDPAGHIDVGIRSDATTVQTLAYDPVEGRFNALTAGDALLSIGLGGGVDRAPVSDPAVEAPQDAAFDPAGRWYVLDGASRSIVRVSPTAEATRADSIPLGAVGSLRPQGLAFNAADGLLYVLADDVLYGLDATGAVAKRFLLDTHLLDPRGMVFAPSADNTDSPSRQTLFVAEAGTSSTLGQISEVSLAAAAVAPTTQRATLVKTTSTAAYSPPSPDPCGVTYISQENRLMLSDSEVEEMSIYSNANLYKTTLAGALQQTGKTTAFSIEPTGVAYRSSDKTLFVSDDDADKITSDRPGADGRWGTADDVVTSFSTKPYVNTDPEDVAYDPASGHLFTIDGVGTEVYDISPGANGRFDGAPSKGGDDTATHFDVAQYGATDPEGIAVSAAGHVLVLDHKPQLIFETTKAGALVNTIDVSAARAIKAAGLGLAPAASNAARTDLYIVDRGVDNDPQPTENDGKLYEMTTSAADQPPTVTITNPTSNSTVAGTVNVTANAADDAGVQRVEFRINGALLGTDTSATGGWTVAWNTANGSYPDGAYTVTATAVDTGNQSATHSVNVNVDNVDLPPAVTVTNPANNATVSGTVNVTANPTDDRGISKVEFLVNNVLIGTDTSATGGWTATWATANGSFPDAGSPYTVTATATDTGGQTASGSISVSVNNDGPPTVSITAPAPGTVSGTVQVTAIAGDTTTAVARVEFLANATSIGTDVDGADGWSVSWNTRSLPNGPANLTAVATDAAGNARTSDPVAVTVSNQTTATALNVPVKAAADDAEERTSGSTYIDSSDLELVTDAGNVQTVGMRFAGVTVPRNATVTNAYVQFTVDEVTTGATSLTLRAQAADAAATFVAGTGNRNISSRPVTGASVAWTPPAWSTVGAHGADQRTPDLSAVVQEVVSRAGWASGNAMAVVITGTGTRTASAFESGAALAPVLHVEYTA